MKAILVFFLCLSMQVLADGQKALVAYTDLSQLVAIANNAGVLEDEEHRFSPEAVWDMEEGKFKSFEGVAPIFFLV